MTSAVSMIVPLFAVPLVRKYPPNKLFFAATMTISCAILLIGFCAVCGVCQIMPVMISVVLITILDCVTIAAAIPMQMTSSVMLQTGVEKSILGRVSATLRMISIVSVAAGEMLFGTLNDATWVWLPIFLGSVGVAAASLMFRRFMTAQNTQDSPKESI